MEKSDIRVFERTDNSGNVLIFKASYTVSVQKYILVNDIIQCPELKKEIIEEAREELWKHYKESTNTDKIDVNASV